ncbi:MAG TPA: outer membrane lipoprotein carrier protein LolA [Syntrophales bacterium]|nr:outer membrane lipoprotein carrier protein LolA [Syntrophales bacterium]HOM06055.1 outer membrane lipoprotein carrier protein LolA [Syntrophales bacterium]HON99081.1 outer membrane lipoprotein carrier protein LolA [Syntrophales bacterium]HPC00455.1 outer membrane lipoprotein carrier protein LolA [Syntrophales bacterium]HPQ05538.1 outer membrane lipoprotein carrier protein LolA [Syntrophales bacterium]
MGKRFLKKIVVVVLVLSSLLCLPLPLPAAETPGVEEILGGMQRVYDETADLRASFTQELSLRSLGRRQVEEGEVFFKRPAKILWEYRKPREKRLVLDGRKAWLYIPADRAVYVQEADRVFQSQLPVRLLRGLGNIRDDFGVTLDPDRPRDGEGNYRLRLRPLRDDLGVQGLVVTVEKETYRLLGCRFVDRLGNETVLRLRNIRVNTGIPDGRFRFTPPRGADVFPMP